MIEPTWGPVISAIDAGHVDHGGKCPPCRRKYPCPVIEAARHQQAGYAVELRHQQAVRAGVDKRKGHTL